MDPITFEKDVQQQFEKAGWKEGRNVFDLYEKITATNNFPRFLKDFLKEYGNLTVLETKVQKHFDSGVNNQLRITLDYAGFDEEEDEKYYFDLLGKTLYAFAYSYPDLYWVACDADGKVYLVGDYIVMVSDNFISGIEMLVKDDWSKGYLQFNEKTKTWDKSLPKK